MPQASASARRSTSVRVGLAGLSTTTSPVLSVTADAASSGVEAGIGIPRHLAWRIAAQCKANCQAIAIGLNQRTRLAIECKPVPCPEPEAALFGLDPCVAAHLDQQREPRPELSASQPGDRDELGVATGIVRRLRLDLLPTVGP